MTGYELVLMLKPILVGYAVLLDQDWSILAGQIMQESSGDPNAEGLIGEIGLAQLIPKTAKDMFENVSSEKLKTPEVNAIVQGKYLYWIQAYLAHNFGTTNYDWVLAAYNWGIGNVRNHLKKGKTLDEIPASVKIYIEKVHQKAEQFKSSN